MDLLGKLMDHKQAGSLAAKLRARRFELFKSLLTCLDRPIKILDVGGQLDFWQAMDFSQQPGVTITLLNLTETQTTAPGFSSVPGDARDLRQFKDDEFDVVFSNSVIEHVGPYHDQRRMAKEIIRVGKRYFLQTPNRYFPIEPHFLFPFFQFLPQRLQIWLLGHFSLGWYDKIPDKLQAARAVGSVNLLDKSQIKKLFPGATIVEERFLALAKSFMIYHWPDRRPAARPAGGAF